jgi:hypothetical protein
MLARLIDESRAGGTSERTAQLLFRNRLAAFPALRVFKANGLGPSEGFEPEA